VILCLTWTYRLYLYLRRMECNPVNFMNDKLAQLLPETELRSIRFYIQWNKKERVAAVRDFCSSAWSNYTLKIQQKYNDRCGLDPAKIAVSRATFHHGALKSLSEVFFMLQTLMLPADRGLFRRYCQSSCYRFCTQLCT
jgi:hypothetical protein